MTTWKRSLQKVKKNKIFSLLGLATRSRNVVSGEFMTEKAVKEGRAQLVIVADDASANTATIFAGDNAFWIKLPGFSSQFTISIFSPLNSSTIELTLAPD